MKTIYWILRLVLVILLTGFFIKNADPVNIRFYLGYEWTAPLALIMLLFFVVGVVMGLLILFGSIFRLRRELAAFRRTQSRRLEADLTTPGAPDLSSGP
jgi:lipopolysaccharide assembly protein A